MNAVLSARLHHAIPLSRPRPGRLDLTFRRVRGHTRIGHQFASYPFHLTRSFDLDEEIPQLTTLYTQSASGGLYRGEDLAISVTVGDGAAAHVTTQSATIVHDTRGEPAKQTVRLSAGTGAFLAFTPDPLILFPGASLINLQTVRVSRGSVVYVSDAFATHDPTGSGLSFDRCLGEVLIEDAAGRRLVSDRMLVAGQSLAAAQGRWPTAATSFILGEASRLPDPSDLRAATNVDGAVCGVTLLPNGAGYSMRCLAADSRTQKRIDQSVLALLARFHFGAALAPRRK